MQFENFDTQVVEVEMTKDATSSEDLVVSPVV